MATIEDVANKIIAVKASLSAQVDSAQVAIVNEITEIKALIQGIIDGSVTPAQLDSVITQLDELQADANAKLAQVGSDINAISDNVTAPTP